MARIPDNAATPRSRPAREPRDRVACDGEVDTMKRTTTLPEPELSTALPANTAERIAQAALEQFTEFGIHRTSIEDIARRAGVSRVTVYRNVGSKDEVIRLVMAREAQRAMKEIDQALTGEQTPGARSRSALRSSCGSSATTRC